jgi:chorismate mutase / prephenate dehydratase
MHLFLAKRAPILYPMAMSDIIPELAEFRRRIDELDDKLIELLKERIGIVAQVGEMKRKESPGQCPLRAGREAEMVRRLIKKFEGSQFSPAAAAAMWRLLIGASTAVEGPLKIAVFAPEKDDALYWLAREYFGPFLPVARQPVIKRVLGDVLDGKAAVGIVPMLRSSDTTNWWVDLMHAGKDAPKIFAHIPFVHYGRPSPMTPMGLAIGRIAPEPTGDDISFWVIETDYNVSQSRMQTAFKATALEANWITIATLNPTSRHHLLEINGFVSADHEGMKKLLASLADSVKNTVFLGAYATPVTL